MSSRLIRQIAIQTLYQIDARNGVCDSDVEQAVMEMPYASEVREQGLEMARSAWLTHSQADEAATRFAPAWPTHRQPVVDRSILRLAYYELKQTDTPGRIVLDEAIELAKEFGSESSPAFINGVLDRILHELIAASGAAACTDEPLVRPTGDAWLDEALIPPPLNSPLAQPIIPTPGKPAAEPPAQTSHHLKDQ